MPRECEAYSARDALTKMTDDDDRTANEREADRLIKESGPLQERRRIREAAIDVHRRIRRGEIPEPVTVGDTTIS
jgi:hypothetical protein